MFEFNKVKLISNSCFLNAPDLSILDQISFVARVSNPSNQMNFLTSDKLCKYLLKNKHYSPFEMVSICIEIETTRDISRQILRHRSFSFQEFSTRYADSTKELGFVNRECRIQDVKNRQMSVDIETDNNLNVEFTRLQNELIATQQNMYNFCIENKIAKEQSRSLLSEGLIKTKLYMAGTLRSWIHYIEVRGDINTTQREHYDIAIKCKQEIEKIFPLINDI
jgi:thymidylate synthase (FAD)